MIKMNTRVAKHVGWVVGCFEDLRRFSDISMGRRFTIYSIFLYQKFIWDNQSLK